MNLRIRGEDTLCVYSNTTTPGKRTENHEHGTGSRIGLVIPGKEVNRRSAHTAPYRRTEPEATACVTVWKHTKSLKWGFKKNSKHSGEPSGLRRLSTARKPHATQEDGREGRKTLGRPEEQTAPRGHPPAGRPASRSARGPGARGGGRGAAGNTRSATPGSRRQQHPDRAAGNTRIAPPAWVLHRAGLCPVRRVQKAPRRGDVQEAC